ncbi:MAG: UDP-N-acetylmuramate:L-alanyl-gamma-D-glutamyl-meso-diaminopimelate ligase [Deltaproteobacteria bacterium]|nr:UDP-N-acetylmuramate:L-alanyl-gamma-D-glutamyl-meso-diaminopimelate ligase [Deltaproteobacteria bacterium]
MHVHLIGVCGTGMGSLAGLLAKAGNRVTGSDTAFYPPMSDALIRWGIETYQGFSASHLEPAPDLVVVGNVCRPDNPEAGAAIDAGLRTMSLPAVLEEFFIKGRRAFVVAGTHGKTTTTALLAYLLEATHKQPGFLIGGIPNNFDESFRSALPAGPFVIEGDEYDSAFFEKSPKFWRYRPEVAVLNAIEHDHIDIYPDMEAYRRAFVEFVKRIPQEGLLVAFAGDGEVRAVARHARCRVCYFALRGDACDALPIDWLGAPQAPGEAFQRFDLYRAGAKCGSYLSPLIGDYNIRNAIAALAAAEQGASADREALAAALPGFRGVRRRQQLRGIARGVRVYDDFAHHPTAVAETLKALRQRHQAGKLIAVFEPRSATASRRAHQTAYVRAFRAADLTLIAPVGRPEIPQAQRLDTELLAENIRALGGRAQACESHEQIVERVGQEARDGDTVAVMSNGAFGNIHQRIIDDLTRPRSGH